VTPTGDLITEWQWDDASWSGWTWSAVPIPVRDVATSYATDGRAQLYIAGTNGQIKVIEKLIASAYSGWGSWQDMSHTVAAKAISVGILENGSKQIFMVGTDGVLYTQYQSTPDGPWTGWFSMSAPTLTDIDAGMAADGRLILFGIDTNGNIVTAQKQTTDPGSFWTAFSDLNPQIVGFATLSSFQRQDGRPQVIAIRNGVIWTTYWTGSAWSTWFGF
jgi:hypothetical protein